MTYRDNKSTPRGIVALGAFCVFGATMSGLSAVMLLMPGSILDHVWSIKPQAQRDLQSMHAWGAVLMIAVSATCAVTAIGLLRRARWAHPLAVTLIIVNLVSDVVGAFARREYSTLIGVPIAAVVIAYLLKPGVKAWFYRRD